MSLISSLNSSLQFPVTSKLESSRNTTLANSIKSTSSIVAPSTKPSIKTDFDVSVGIKKIFDTVKSDPEFAKKMADLYAHSQDRELISIDDIPLTDMQAWQEFQNKTNVFNGVAKDITAQRVEIYDSMKANGSSDADIFKALMDFNKSLPLDYQLKTGLVRYDLSA